MRAALFPGQGVDATAVHDALAGAPLADDASEELGFDLTAAVGRHLDRARPVLPTDLAQPALYVAGLASHSRAVSGGATFDFYAGHSIGEYTALAAAGAVAPRDGLRLVCTRGRAMKEAARSSQGGMAAVKGIASFALEDLCRRTGTVVANDNSTEQSVIAGPDDALSEAARELRAAGARCLLLPVEGAFHSPAMGAAAGSLRDALDHAPISMPAAPVVSNLTARPYRAPGEIRKLLVHQLTERVRFRESLEWLAAAGAHDFVDLGPGRVAAKLAAATLGVPAGA